MRQFKLMAISAGVILGIGLMLVPTPVFADDTAKNNIEKICAANPQSSICKDWDPSNNPEKAVSDTVRNIINIMLFAVGIVAVISIIVSGMRFISSRGDSNAVSKARTSLIYSVVGLVVAVMAFAIVNFVIARLNEGNSGSGGGGCPSGMTWNATTGQCEGGSGGPVAPTPCPSGKIWNATTGQCE
jgi:uncharacterized membrane protein YgcG